VKLWIDEDLSPVLVDAAWSRTWEGTCNRDRGMLGVSDEDVAAAAIGEDFVLVTDNRRDFRRLYQPAATLHPGLIFIPAGGPREQQRKFLDDVLDWIAAEAAARRTDIDSLMVNKLVEMNRDTGEITIEWLPVDPKTSTT
jgi:predicted nuclease of predicted toxin-antitoxin system